MIIFIIDVIYAFSRISFAQNYFTIFYLRMRALYTDDIPGAQPTIRYYEKSLIRHRHEEEI